MKVPRLHAARLIAAIVLTSGTRPSGRDCSDSKATAFDPLVVFTKPGDIVKWTTMAGHDNVSIEERAPRHGSLKCVKNLASRWIKKGLMSISAPRI
jgi:plastocyanin